MNQRPLYAFVYRLCGDMDETGEIVQESFVKAYLGISRFEGRSSFRTWIYRIAVNTYRNHVRDRSRKRLQSLDDNVPSADPDPAEQADRRRKAEMINRAVGALPDRQREALVLRVNEGYPFAEVASVMGCTVGAAKASYHQAVKKLRKAVGGEEG